MQENAGTSLVEAFSLLEIRTHLQMLQTSAAGAKSQVRAQSACEQNSLHKIFEASWTGRRSWLVMRRDFER